MMPKINFPERNYVAIGKQINYMQLYASKKNRINVSFTRLSAVVQCSRFFSIR